MSRNKILITAPSLDNVSGISTLVTDILNNSKLNFVHFKLGSTDGEKKNLLWAMSLAGIYLKLFFVSVFKKYEFVHLNVSLEKASILRDSIVFLIVNKVFGKKVVLHIHGGYYLTNEPESKLLNYLLKKDFNNAKAIIVLSDWERNILTKRYGNLPFSVIPNGVNTTIANGLTRHATDNTIRFVFMAKIVKEKGIFTITESLQYLTKYLDSFTLEIYGAGPDLEEWLDTLRKYPALKFNYRGVVSGVNKWQALRNSDVLLLPSFFEGLPMSMIEAMAAGCSVIITDVGSVKSVITDGVNGMIIPVKSPKQLAGKIEDIMERRIDLETMGRNAKAYVEANLSLSSYTNQLEQLYATL